MPWPETIELSQDFMYCEICGQDYKMNEFAHVIVSNDKQGAEQERRYCAICKYCRQKARDDAEYEKYVTEKVFVLGLGRKLRRGTL